MNRSLPLTRCPLVLLLVLLVAGGSACSSGDEAQKPEAVMDAAALAAEREEKARRLFADAQAATVPDKVILFKRIIAVFPETSVVPRAYGQLVFYLLHRGFKKPEDAHRFARQFEERHGHLVDVGATYNLLYRFEKSRGDPKRAEAVGADWDRWAGSWIEKQKEAPADERLQVMTGLGRLRIWQQRYDEAAELLGRAAALEGIEDRVLRKQALWDRALCLGLDPKKKDQALGVLDEVLALTRDGVRGHTEAEVLAMKTELEEKGKLTPRQESESAEDG